MDNFVIVLKNDKLVSYRRLSIFILLLHLFFFNYYVFKVAPAIVVLAGIGIALISLVIQFTAMRKGLQPVLPAYISFILLAATWAFFSNYWLAAALILLAFLDLVSGRKMELQFSEKEISISSFPKKTVQWNELGNAILKDRILTLDFVNDHLIQGEITSESYGIAEDRFNEFCRQQLAANVPAAI